MIIRPKRIKSKKITIKYPVRFKRIIVELYRSGIRSELDLVNFYRITSEQLHKWTRWYDEHYLQFRTEVMKKKQSEKDAKLAKKNPEKQIQLLHNQIETLKKQLQNEQLKNEGLETMMEIIEKEYKVAFRKKSGSKQSRD